MKLLRNKSKNRNVKNCPLKNKTPRGKGKKKKKEKKRNQRTRMLIALPSLEE